MFLWLVNEEEYHGRILGNLWAILAFLDFWSLSHYLERFLDRCRELLKSYIRDPLSPEGCAIFIGFIKLTLCFFILCFGAALIGRYISYRGVIVALEVAGMIMVFPLIIFFGAIALYFVMHVLKYAKIGNRRFHWINSYIVGIPAWLFRLLIMQWVSSNCNVTIF